MAATGSIKHEACSWDEILNGRKDIEAASPGGMAQCVCWGGLKTKDRTMGCSINAH